MRVDESRLTATYMMASRRHGTIYLGSALDLIVRVNEHREGIGSRFVARYGVTKLVWFEPFILVADARVREYELKKWRRDWKVELIEQNNPDWSDLFPILTGAILPKPKKP
ncbi:MAG: GIY-YIG nuclease family protein [Terricaulis sp.]